MRVTFVLILVLLGTVMTPVSSAAHDWCGSDGYPALGIVMIDAGPAGTYYVDDRNLLLGNGIWVYQESNDALGLQRGGYSEITPNGDLCTDDPDGIPDRLVF